MGSRSEAINRVRALHQKKHRAEERLFLVQGRKMVAEALASPQKVELVFASVDAARELADALPVVVVNLHTVKPLDREALVKAARDAGAVVTVEEHQVAGGMGSAVAELLAKECPVPIEFVGVHDRFGQSGEPAELLREYRMDAASIVEAVRKAAKRK